MKRITLLLAFALALTSCGDTPYKALSRGYRAVLLTKTFGELVDGTVKGHLEAVRAECTKKHAVQTAEYDACVLPAVRFSRSWTGIKNGKPTGKGVLPALQSAQKATKLSLDVAFEYIKSHEKECGAKPTPSKCYGNWINALKKGLCPLVELVDRGIKIGAMKWQSNAVYQTVVGYAKLLGGCK